MTQAVAASPTSLDLLCINTVRTLAMDAVQKANSGHPGRRWRWPRWRTSSGSATCATIRPIPTGPDRDRFVLSCGHACMLQYAALYLTGYDLSLDDLKQFRQWGSHTPGHPEYGHTPGVEMTTGPLGQGVGNAVGMALAEAHLAATFNRPGHAMIDHYTYFVCSDGDLMEGVSHEACSFAGHLKLGKLIGLYDDNHITIDGKTELTFSDDTAKRFESYGWHVQRVATVTTSRQIDAAITAARRVTDRPSLIVMRTHIGFGSPNKQDTPGAHGAPLGEDEVKLTKQNLGWPSLEPFYVPDEALAHWRQSKERGAKLEAEWKKKQAAYSQAHPDLAAELERRLAGRLPDGWDSDLPVFTTKDAQATRAAFGEGTGGGGGQSPGVDRRLGRSRRVHQCGRPQRGRARTREFGRAEHALRDPRARHGRGHERHGSARRRAARRGNLSHLLRVHAAADPAGGAVQSSARSTSSRTTRLGWAKMDRPISRLSSSHRCVRFRTSWCCARRIQPRWSRRGASPSHIAPVPSPWYSRGRSWP